MFQSLRQAKKLNKEETTAEGFPFQFRTALISMSVISNANRINRHLNSSAFVHQDVDITCNATIMCTMVEDMMAGYNRTSRAINIPYIVGESAVHR